MGNAKNKSHMSLTKTKKTMTNVKWKLGRPWIKEGQEGVDAKKVMNLLRTGKDVGNVKIGKAIGLKKVMSF